MQKILLKVRYIEIGWSKTHKKSQLYFFFLTQSLLIDKVIKNKRDLENVQSLFRLWKFQKNSFVSYILSDKGQWCNIKQFLSYFKNCICKLIQANSWHHKLFHFHLSFCICKVWKGSEKFTKVWISWEQKELSWWNKKHFS